MKFLELTLPTPELNLALDEALLNDAEARNEPTEVLRLWESPTQIVVIGRASKIAEEVNLSQCVVPSGTHRTLAKNETELVVSRRTVDGYRFV